MADEQSPLLNGSDDTSLQSYTYEALPPGVAATRLLTIRPGKQDDPLQATLRVHRLDWRIPQYEALSYCWGDVTQDIHEHSICIEGKPLSITSSAHNTLRSSRASVKSTRVWIDQICINQRDLNERSEQVRYMGLVFRRASTVTAHLGEHFENDKLLFDFMRAAADAHRDPWAWWRRQRKIPIPVDSPLRSVFQAGTRLHPHTFAAMEPFDSRLDECRAALEALQSLPWFSRIWIVQEAGLAKRLRVRVGHHIVGWDELYQITIDMPYSRNVGLMSQSAIAGFKTTTAIEMLRRESIKHMSLIDRWSRAVDALRSWRTIPLGAMVARVLAALVQTNYLPILNLLREFRHQASTDERDKIFAMIGMTSPSLMEGFLDQMSYMQNLFQCYFYFGVMHIVTTGTLDVLSATCHTGPAHNALPYWCPDWSFKASQCDTKYCMGTYTSPPHRAGLNYRANVGYFHVENRWALILKGFQIDEVAEVVEKVFSVNTYSDPTDSTWDEWTTFAMQTAPADPYELDEKRWEAYWRTLVYDSDGGSDHAREGLGEVVRDFLQGRDAPREGYYKGEFAGRFVWVCRKLYRTKRGFLGNGCSNVLPGDKVFICYGGRFPLLVREDKVVSGQVTHLGDERRSQSTQQTLMGYMLIGGDTYVHGLCEGEGFDIAEREDIEPGAVCLT